jgi:hypothetical protein
MMKRVDIALLATVLVSIASAAHGGDAAPNLTGTWKEVGEGSVVRRGGPFEHFDNAGPEPKFGSPGHFRVSIERQEGAAFSGTWATEARTDPLVGVVSSDGRTLYLADDNGAMQGRLLDDGGLEVCRALVDSSRMLATCRTFRRDPG